MLINDEKPVAGELEECGVMEIAIKYPGHRSSEVLSDCKGLVPFGEAGESSDIRKEGDYLAAPSTRRAK
jgi:hypothetical protein